MKILIITYFKENNPGTFLQAFGVQYAYKQIFPEAEIVYLDYSKIIKEIKQATASDMPTMPIFQKIIHVLALKKRARKFKQEQNRCFSKSPILFEFFPDAEGMKKFIDFANSFDIVSVGSDTILESMIIDSKPGIMWLPQKLTAKKIFFAASADTASNFSKCNHYFEVIRNSVEDFISVGIRDEVTRKFLIETVGVTPSKVLAQPDPTFFLPLSLFSLSEEKKRKIPNGRKVIFYHMDRRFKYRKELAQLLKAKGYFLFTSEYDPNCDLSFKSITPFEWAALFGLCDYVITERFHDTVFSMRYATPVLTCEWYSGIVDSGVSSKRESIAMDFDNHENYFRISKEADLEKIADRLECIDLEKFKKKSIAKVSEMQASATTILNQIKQSCQEYQS